MFNIGDVVQYTHKTPYNDWASQNYRFKILRIHNDGIVLVELLQDIGLYEKGSQFQLESNKFTKVSFPTKYHLPDFF